MAVRFRNSYGPLQFLNFVPCSTFEQMEPYPAEDLSSYWSDFVPHTIDSNSFSNANDEYLHQDYSTYFSPSFPEVAYNISPLENFPAKDEPFACYYDEALHPKRLRTVYECSAPDCMPNILLDPGEHPAFRNQLALPDFSPVLPTPNINASYVDPNVQNLGADATALSPQSIAARQRRKRISEKTQELGRLIPGGVKMNTAEMLAAAAKRSRPTKKRINFQGPEEDDTIISGGSSNGFVHVNAHTQLMEKANQFLSSLLTASFSSLTVKSSMKTLRCSL
ncbi:Transcription factor [Nymphaea thermarum]|nr:Transcription factor [Nymphaea thermarum]